MDFHGYFVPFARPERWIVRDVAVLLSALAVCSIKSFRRKLVVNIVSDVPARSLAKFLIGCVLLMAVACVSRTKHELLNHPSFLCVLFTLRRTSIYIRSWWLWLKLCETAEAACSDFMLNATPLVTTTQT